jgi:hypothetical protein
LSTRNSNSDLVADKPASELVHERGFSDSGFAGDEDDLTPAA